MNKHTILLALIYFAAANVFADYELSWPKENIKTGMVALPAGVIDSALKFLDEAHRLLPKKMRDEFKTPIKVVFKKLDKNPNEMLPLTQCVDQDSKELPSAEKNFLGEYSKKKNRIVLNSRILLDLVDKNNPLRTFNCGHKSMYRQALAVLLHETAHAYDNLNLRSPDEIAATKFATKNKLRGSKRMVKNLKRNTTISSRENFKKLAHWHEKWRNSSQNTIHHSGPDDYEFKNLKEHFAVNMEYFLLDPQYKIKRPSYYHYYANHFNHQPSANDAGLNINRQVMTSAGKIMNIDPAQVYEVQYLLVSDGSTAASNFGHSLVRFVMCAPRQEDSSGRVVPAQAQSEKCRNNPEHDVVIGYTAQIISAFMKHLKGTFGFYKSAIYFGSFSEVKEQYNTVENRKIFAYKLNLRPDQALKFLNRAIEDYWTYKSSYKFVTNNCAVELRNTIQYVVGEGAFVHTRPNTPKKLLRNLIESGLAQAAPTRVEKNIVARLQTILGGFFPNLSEKKKNKLFAKLKISHAKERMDIYQSMMKSTAAGMAAIDAEIEIKKYLKLKLKTKQIAVLSRVLHKSSSQSDHLVRETAKMIKSLQSGTGISSGSYGIPLEDSQINQLVNLFGEVKSRIEKILKQDSVSQQFKSAAIAVKNSVANIHELNTQHNPYYQDVQNIVLANIKNQ